ncbi:hypothetical protein LAZ67_2004158 [Cordylochernes scorpioides]|uniref:Integrase catalytic domain-containing protein n=1 Tax=Cordylochernes scorpioides TaxID=51811 RepID=A0ABY6K3T9_9ARAC|nr:hypothetical protein LAZ67_2004158 [Cordylochernes scorpioides]
MEDVSRRRREAIRGVFTEMVNDMNTELRDPLIDKSGIYAKFDKLESLHLELLALNERCQAILLAKDEATDDEIDREFEECEPYITERYYLKARICIMREQVRVDGSLAESKGDRIEDSVKTARATEAKPALAKARILKEACSAPSIIDIEYEGKKAVEGGERKETEAAVKCNEVKDSETAVSSYEGVKESKAKPKDDGVKDSEDESKGNGDKEDSEAKPKGDGVKDSETAIKGYKPVSNSRAVAEDTDSREEENLDVEQGTDSRVEENPDAEQGTESRMEEGIIDTKDWLNDGFIEGVDEIPPEGKGYWFPDRPVFGCESETTPIRPVCDGASCRGHGARTLRRYLKRRPILLRRIPEIGIKLRKNKYGVLADMGRYFQVMAIKENDWDYLRFLWKRKMDACRATSGGVNGEGAAAVQTDIKTSGRSLTCWEAVPSILTSRNLNNTIHLSDINKSYRCEFEALGHPLICGSMPPVCPRSFLEGSEELDVSDLMRDRIEVLIGADIAGRLLTGDQRRISSGLVAIRTKLGWTVMGKIPPTEVRDDTSSLCVTTLLSLDLENLWKLDAIGVSDAEVEKKTQSLQAEMEEHFAHTTTRDIEGRYEVALPWVQDKESIPSNRDLAENQLSSVRRKLEEVGDMNEYGQIFEECINQGIIEYSREDKLDGVHNLPHRPVYKRNSQTSKIRPVFNASARKRDKLSLDDCLDKGPNLIEIIPILLNKFRKYEVGVSSDIEKAFLQIGIKEEDRDAAVFEIAGVDLTGHLILKNKKKAWIVIFTCAVYRGVHLELVTSLSMEAFLQAFRRFIARRGRPLIVYSDNGTNFKGMANALKKIDFSRLKCDPTLKNITWKFIPPGAPWWGGWWERLIGMMKQLLFRILGQTSLGYEELSTVMCDVESLMNTRPLTYLTEESEDLAPLTPSLFLQQRDLDLIDNQTLSRKYQYIKRVREDLRERFRIEYFGFLRQETRRLKTTIPFKVGDMVLIGQESLKRLHWPLARIIQLYPGKGGLVRVAKVKTSSGDKIRPIQKFYNLEITPEIRCRDPLTERSPTQEVRLTTEEDPLTSQQEQHHIETPNVVSSHGRPIKRPKRLDLLNFSFPCLTRRDANSKVGEMLEKKASEAANGRPAEAATGMQRLK